MEFHRKSLVVAVSASLLTTAMPSLAETVLEEMTITAQKREQNLQDVPIAVSAFSGDTVKALGAQSVNDLGMFSAGVETNASATTQAKYSIRGIGTSDFSAGSDPSIGIYVDGIYASRSGSAQVNFNDIERVEILRGPQGTLFGRNAAGGAINIITKKPSQQTEGYVEATVGNFNKRKLSFGANGALSDSIALRYSATLNRRDGWLKNLTSGEDLGIEDDQTHRLSVLLTPSDNSELIWATEYNEIDEHSVVDKSQNILGGDLYDNYENDTDILEERDLFGTSLTLNQQFEAFSLKTIAAYRTFNTINRQDEDATADPQLFTESDNIEHQEQYSLEFLLNGETGNFNWTAGASWFKEDIEQNHVIRFTTDGIDSLVLFNNGVLPPEMLTLENRTALAALVPAGAGLAGLVCGFQNAIVPNSCDPSSGADVQNTLLTLYGAGDIGPGFGQGRLLEEQTDNFGKFESTALFGDITWAATENLDVTVGARYTRDEKDFRVFSQWQNTMTVDFGAGPQVVPFAIAFFNNGRPVLDESPSNSWDALTGRLVLDYQLNDDAMTYFSLAQGFKSGGFNSLNYTNDELGTFDEEKITNYEVGLKSSWLDKSLRLNTALFFYEYKDLQDLDLVGAPGTIPSYNLRNADAEGQGLEIELSWALTPNLVVESNYSYLETEYTKWTLLSFESPDSDRTGQSLSSMPKHKLNLAALYTADLQAGILSWRLDYNFTDKKEYRIDKLITPDGSGIYTIDSFNVINTRLSFTPSDSPWTVAGWVKNLTDEKYLWSAGGTGEAVGSNPVNRGPGRFYGLDLNYNF